MNGINLEGLRDFVDLISKDKSEAIIDYSVQLDWKGGTDITVKPVHMKLGQKEIQRDFEFELNEPEELLGSNKGPTPQEYILAGVAGCVAITFAVNASAKGITLDKLKVKIDGQLDLRGFAGLPTDKPVGFEEVTYKIYVKGDGTKEQYEEISKRVTELSPGFASLANSVKVIPKVILENF